MSNENISAASFCHQLAEGVQIMFCILVKNLTSVDITATTEDENEHRYEIVEYLDVCVTIV